MKAADPTWSRPKTRLTRAGRRRATSQSRQKSKRKAPANPSSGEKTIPRSTLATPSVWIASVPAAATPAPTIEKTSAWLELDGMPYHQVTRFQAIADSSAAATSCWVASSGAMIPLPIVVATAVPVNAPTTFSVEAIRTAWPGVSTRVATEVAIALAVSWNPLMKSNTNASATMTSRTSSSVSGIFNEDAFEGVGDVLTAIGRVLQDLVELAPAERADELRNLRHPVVERRQGGAERVVPLVLQPVQLQDVPTQFLGVAPGLFQERYGASDGVTLLS